MVLHSTLHAPVRAIVHTFRGGIRRLFSFVVLTVLGLATLMPLPAMAMLTDQPLIPFRHRGPV